MIEALLLALIAVLAVIVAVKVAYALVLLAAWLVVAVIRGIIVPVLHLIHVLVLRPIFWIVGNTIALPFRLAGLMLRPLSAAPVSGLVLGPVCRNGSCRCANPTEARYCRRCGATIALA